MGIINENFLNNKLKFSYLFLNKKEKLYIYILYYNLITKLQIFTKNSNISIIEFL